MLPFQNRQVSTETCRFYFFTLNSSLFTLEGLTLDTAWENIVKSIGHIEVKEGNTLTEQIATDDKRAKLLAQIATLERKMAAEKQPRRKREYFEQIKRLKESLQ